MKIHSGIKKIGRIVFKTALLFAAFNVAYAALSPLPAISRATIHNELIPGRMRIQAANIKSHDFGYGRATTNIDLMLATHEINAAPRAADEFRVLLMGDSAAWGYLLDDGETLAAQINQQDRVMMDGRRIRVFNMAVPGIYATKDVLLMQRIQQYAPDLVVWLVTPEAFRRDAQKNSEIVCLHQHALEPLLAQYDAGDLGCAPAPAKSLFQRTLVGDRRELAVVLQTQFDGLLWAATGIDHHITKPKTLARAVEASTLWWGMPGPRLQEDDLILNAMDAARDVTGGALLIVNEPILVLDGPNSDVRYNKELPRWAFDQATAMMEARALALNVPFVNLWNAVPADQFTDHELHYTAAAAAKVARLMGDAIISMDMTSAGTAVFQ